MFTAPLTFRKHLQTADLTAVQLPIPFDKSVSR